MSVVISIKPIYSNEIMSGGKTVELRRRFPSTLPTGTIAYIYSTSPIKAIIGVVKIQSVEKILVEEIWERYSHMASIKKNDFDEYFFGKKNGFVIILSNPCEYKEPVSLVELRDKFDFTPPQSFNYAKESLIDGLSNK